MEQEMMNFDILVLYILVGILYANWLYRRWRKRKGHDQKEIAAMVKEAMVSSKLKRKPSASKE